MNPLSPDLQQSAINTLYLTVSHNYVPLSYLVGVLLSLFMALIKPSRFSILLLIGFGLLLFGYEYDKHIIVAFREQTLNSLATVTTHYKFQKLINLIISNLLPVFFYTFGWLFIYLAIIYSGLKNSKKKGS